MFKGRFGISCPLLRLFLLTCLWLWFSAGDCIIDASPSCMEHVIRLLGVSFFFFSSRLLCVLPIYFVARKYETDGPHVQGNKSGENL
jgi:hypothetical protein